MALHAFADESYRPGWYYVCVTVVPDEDRDRLRRVVSGLLLPGQRHVHMKRESRQRRRTIVDAVARAGVRSQLFAVSAGARRQEAARRTALAAAVPVLVERKVVRLVLGTRGDRDVFDAKTLREALGAHPRDTGLRFEHAEPAHEPLIALADVIGWAYGAGGDWRRRIIDTVTVFTPPG